jgi:hypothetical protein
MDALLTTDYLLIAADWRQSQGIVESCHSGGTFIEVNPLLGKCPSMAKLNLGVLAGASTVTVLANTLNQPYRTTFLKAVGIVEVGFVGHNWSVGLHFTH